MAEKLTLDEIKSKMIDWRDFYGGQLLDIEAVKKANTKEELIEIIEEHSQHIEAMETDAQGHLSKFQKEIGLSRWE